MQHTGPTSRSATPSWRPTKILRAGANKDWTTQLNQAQKKANSCDQIIRVLSVDSASASLGLDDTLAANSRSVPDASFEALASSFDRNQRSITVFHRSVRTSGTGPVSHI
jgi:hypothetical protein